MNSLRRQPGKSGFTLLEIMIVVLVVSILLAMALPNFLRARDNSRSKACTKNLQQIETAKEQWAMNNHVAASASPNADQLVSDYIKGTPGILPICPSGGTYSINPLTTEPTCTIGTNSTADKFDDHVLLK